MFKTSELGRRAHGGGLTFLANQLAVLFID